MRTTALSLYFLFFTFSCHALMVSDLSTLENLHTGDSKKIKITLTNELEKDENVELKLYDYSCNCDGQHFFDEIGTAKRSNASWISLNADRVSLKSKESQDVFITIDVPNDSNLNGSYWSVLMIEPADPVKSLDQNQGFSLNVKIRFAHHLVTNINKGNAKLKIIDKNFTFLNDKKYFYVDVDNIGDVFLNPKLQIKFYNLQGKLEKTLTAQKERLYPGNTQRYHVDPIGLENKTYKAFLLLDNEDSHIFGDSFEIKM